MEAQSLVQGRCCGCVRKQIGEYGKSMLRISRKVDFAMGSQVVRSFMSLAGNHRSREYLRCNFRRGGRDALRFQVRSDRKPMFRFFANRMVSLLSVLITPGSHRRHEFDVALSNLAVLLTGTASFV